jgi:hypothetical protein
MEDTDMWHGLDRGITEARSVTDRPPEALHATIGEAAGPIVGEARGRLRRGHRP